ncbi:MAG: hypothetical protein JKY52_00250 [Flavobacteriales bacterium]|nr:hypothetical protein [Flavobacteriales bacterium]
MTDMTPEQQLTADLEKAMEENFSPDETEAVAEEVTKAEEPEVEESTEQSEPEEPADSTEANDEDGEKQPEASDVVEESDTALTEDDEELLTVSESWSKEDRAVFDGMEPDAQQILLQQSRNLQKGFTRKSMKRADDLKSYEDIASLYSGMEVQLNQAGLNPVTATQRLVGAQQALMQNPEAGLRQLMQEYGGGDLKGIVTRMATDLGITAAAEEGQAEYMSDTERALQQRVTAMEQSQIQRAQETQTQQVNALQNQVNLFEGATDDQGNKLHPHFNEVQNVIVSLINGDPSLNLDAAYAKAVLTIPKHFDSLVNDRVTAAQKTADAKRKQKVAQSKDAGFNVNSNKAPAKSRDKRANLDDAINDSMSNHKFG